MLRNNLVTLRDADLKFGFPLIDWKNFSEERGEGGKKMVESYDLAAILGDTVEFETKRTKELIRRVATDRFRTMFLNKDAWPARSKNRDLVLSGSIDLVDFGGRKQLMISRRREDDDSVYVHLRTGLNTDRGSRDLSEVERIKVEIRDMIMMNKNPQAHGAFLLTGEDSLGSVGGESVADRVKGITGKFSAFLGGPAVRHSLWRLGAGVQLVVREVSGVIYTVTYDGKEIIIDDGTPLIGYFEEKMAALQEQARKRREEFLQQQKQKRSKRKGEQEVVAEPAEAVDLPDDTVVAPAE